MDNSQKPILELREINNYNKYKECICNEKEIDSGTYGTVYKAYVNQILPIAVKKMKLPKNCQQEVKTLIRENDFLMNIKHPNIVKVYFHFHYKNQKDTNYYYIGMEYIEQNLETYITKRLNNKLNKNEVNDLAYQLQKGLSYLEKINTAHRDLKPANVLVNDEGVYKLCDFSEMKYQESTIRDMMNSIRGTRSYLAPELRIAVDKQEQIVCNPVKADVFSYGLIILQSLLTCSTITISGLNQQEEDIKQMIQSYFSMGFKEFLKMCLSFNPQSRLSFINMNDIFQVNHIENYYENQKMKNKLAKLTKEKKESQLVIDDLLDQQSKLKNSLEQLQKQTKNNSIYEPKQNQQQKQLIIQSSKLTEQQVKQKEEKLQEIFEANQNSWKNDEKNKTIQQIKTNSGFTAWGAYYLSWGAYSSWGASSSYYYSQNKNYKYKFPYLSNEDGSEPCFKKDEMPKAVALIQKLSQETGMTEEVCLKMLHSNQWNYQKSKNDIMNC